TVARAPQGVVHRIAQPVHLDAHAPEAASHRDRDPLAAQEDGRRGHPPSPARARIASTQEFENSPRATAAVYAASASRRARSRSSTSGAASRGTTTTPLRSPTTMSPGWTTIPPDETG